ncbi:MAG: hypothetical protein ACI9XR_001732 [Flavobacterium sp.]|jgi:hypothetical protein
MKTKLIIASAFSLVLAISCGKKESNDTETSTTETIETTKVVTVQDSVQQDGTSVSIGSDGVSVENQNGQNKVDVNVTKDEANVEIKK